MRWRNPPIGRAGLGARRRRRGGRPARLPSPRPAGLARRGRRSPPCRCSPAWPAGVAWREQRQRREDRAAARHPERRDPALRRASWRRSSATWRRRSSSSRCSSTSSAAVNATLDTEKIYEQALDRLVHRMGFQAANLFLVDPGRGVVRGAPQRGRRAAPGPRRRSSSARRRRQPGRPGGAHRPAGHHQRRRDDRHARASAHGARAQRCARWWRCPCA